MGTSLDRFRAIQEMLEQNRSNNDSIDEQLELAKLPPTNHTWSIGSIVDEGMENFHANVRSEAEQLLAILDTEFKNSAGRFLDIAGAELKNRIITVCGIGGLVAKLDRDGGNVDTIHNARQGVYATNKEREAYENRGEYNSSEYHSNSDYIAKNREAKQKQADGELTDAYTGKKFGSRDKFDQDHVKSAKEIHDDPGRVLAGMDGSDLANKNENLVQTSPEINRSKKQDSMDDYLNSERDSVKKVDEQRAKEADRKARAAIDKEINKKYYLGKEFRKNLSVSSAKEGFKMGGQQVLGLFLVEFSTELLKSVKKVFTEGKHNTESFIKKVGIALKQAFEVVLAKWKDFIQAFKDGFLSGLLSNIVTTVINIFFTTAKHLIRIIREGFYAIVRAVKLLANPPEGMSKAEAWHEASKILISVGVTAVTLALGVQFNFAGMPPWLSNIIEAILGAIVGSILLYGWEKLDLLGVKKSARHDFIMKSLQEEDDKLNSEIDRWNLVLSKAS